MAMRPKQTLPDLKYHKRQCKSMDKQKNKTAGAAEAEVPQHIGRKLREMYDHIAEQPVPDRFKQLLDQLEQSTTEA